MSLSKQPVWLGSRRIFLSLPIFISLAVSAFAQTTPSVPAKRSAASARSEQIQKAIPSRPNDCQQAAEWDTMQLKLHKVRELRRLYRLSAALDRAIELELTGAEKIRDSLKQGKIDREKGIREEGFYCDNDASFQPFMRFLPSSYQKDKPNPLIVYLHGYSPYLNLINWTSFPTGLTDLAEKTGYCVLMPFARSNTDFQSIGEQDVLMALEHMCKRYSIDRDRIVLVGLSMGGMGAWTIGAHYPHLFAGVAILSGRGDYYFWHDLKRDAVPAYKRRLVDTEFAANQLPNLAPMPLISYHGNADPLIPVAEARHMAKLMGPLNPDFKLIEIEGGDHWIYDRIFARKDLATWLKARKRLSPETFTFIIHHPRYHRAYWLDVTEFGPGVWPRQIKVTKKADHLVVEGDVRKVAIDRKRLPVEARKARVTAANDIALEEKALSDDYVPDTFSWGPIKDAFLQPFAFVSCQKDSENGISSVFRQRVVEWYRYSKSFPRFYGESELSEANRKRLNLFLFGEPENSELIRKALLATPVKVTKDSYVIGSREYPRKDHGLWIKYRSPWNVDRSVVVQCGIPWGKHSSPNHIYDSPPGVMVYSADKAKVDPDGGNQAVFAGFFNEKGELE